MKMTAFTFHIDGTCLLHHSIIVMDIMQTTHIPEIKETIVKLQEMSADEVLREQAFLRERQMRDERNAMEGMRRIGLQEGMEKGKAEMIERMRKKGYSEEAIKALFE